MSYRIEPLNSAHVRTDFCCGIIEPDQYFHLRAGQDMRRSVAATFVALDQLDSIAGYYSLAAYAVQLPDLPGPVAKKLPRYPLLPATKLGRLAVSQTHQGRVLGGLLLTDALQRRWKNTAEVASIGVVVEAVNEAARAIYLHHEFTSLLGHEGRMFISMDTIEKLVTGH